MQSYMLLWAKDHAILSECLREAYQLVKIIQAPIEFHYHDSWYTISLETPYENMRDHILYHQGATL